MSKKKPIDFASLTGMPIGPGADSGADIAALMAVPPPPKIEKKILEKDVEGPAKRYARDHGVHVRKFKSPGNRSVPDDIFFFPETAYHTGRIFYVEFKAPGKKPTDDQVREMYGIQRAGGKVFVIDNLVDAEKLIDWGLSNKLPLEYHQLPGWFKALDYPNVRIV